MRIIRKLTGDCPDGTCPAVYATDNPEVLAVQGTALTDPQAIADTGAPVPGHESIVLIPRAVLEAGIGGG